MLFNVQKIAIQISYLFVRTEELSTNLAKIDVSIPYDGGGHAVLVAH